MCNNTSFVLLHEYCGCIVTIFNVCLLCNIEENGYYEIAYEIASEMNFTICLILALNPSTSFSSIFKNSRYLRSFDIHASEVTFLCV